jgi:kynurenine formamidase
MKIDLTLKVNPRELSGQNMDVNRFYGHLGTHFDVMDRSFPLEYTELPGIVFDVAAITGRDIEVSDIDLERIKAGMFVAFHTGFIDRFGYGSEIYRHEHPQLSHQLIEKLTERGVAIIGVDCAGIRRGREHTPADRYCAERGCFVVENLCALGLLAAHNGRLLIHTYPLNITGLTGLPCRVIAETGEENN